VNCGIFSIAPPATLPQKLHRQEVDAVLMASVVQRAARMIERRRIDGMVVEMAIFFSTL
jgi:hypothetical protein